METSDTTTNSNVKKSNGKMAVTLGKIQDIVESQPQLKAGLEHVMDAKDEWIEEGGQKLSRAGQFLANNWKTIVPAIAAVGLGAFFLTGAAKPKKRARK